MSAPIENLTEWLVIATYELTPPAQERIRQEIESHFQEAMEAYQAEGQSEAEARTQALANLGDASAAAKRFRQFHLTIKEAKYLEETWHECRKVSKRLWQPILFYAFVLLILSMLLGLPLFISNLHRPTRDALILFVIYDTLIASAKFWILGHNCNPSIIRHLYTLEILGGFSWTAFLVCGILFWIKWGVLWWFCVPQGFRDSIGMIRIMPLWVKLNRMDDFSRELPPSAVS